MILVTGSHLERALECSASTCLPKAKNSSPEASEGRAIHIYIEFVSEYGRDKALAVMRDSPTLRDYVDVCEVIDTDLLPTDLAHEVAFAFDIATGKAREIGRGNKVNYAECNLAPLEIPCRLDVVGVSADAVFVGDYKSGHLAVTGAKTNIQVGFGALCASLAYGKDSAVVEIIRTGRGGAKPFRDRAELDAFDLDALASRLRDWIPRRGRVLDVINAGKAPTVYQGPWCRYCPSYNYCPAKTALAIRMGTGVEVQELSTELTPETAAAVYHRAKAASQFLDKIFGAIYGMAKNEAIDLGNGTMLGEREKRGNEKLDGDIVYEVLKLDHSQEIAQAAVKRTATKTGIEAALRGKVPKLAPAMREVVARVRKMGGSERKDSIKVMEYPKET